jgi:hypothetical protein
MLKRAPLPEVREDGRKAIGGVWLLAVAEDGAVDPRGAEVVELPEVVLDLGAEAVVLEG